MQYFKPEYVTILLPLSIAIFATVNKFSNVLLVAELLIKMFYHLLE